MMPFLLCSLFGSGFVSWFYGGLDFHAFQYSSHRSRGHWHDRRTHALGFMVPGYDGLAGHTERMDVEDSSLMTSLTAECIFCKSSLEFTARTSSHSINNAATLCPDNRRP
jgi:hypothetical protein